MEWLREDKDTYQSHEITKLKANKRTSLTLFLNGEELLPSWYVTDSLWRLKFLWIISWNQSSSCSEKHHLWSQTLDWGSLGFPGYVLKLGYDSCFIPASSTWSELHPPYPALCGAGSQAGYIWNGISEHFQSARVCWNVVWVYFTGFSSLHFLMVSLLNWAIYPEVAPA